MRRTKIVCTMGPSTMKGEGSVIREMIASGMNVARFNFSHGDHKEQEERLILVKKLREEMCVPVSLLLDTKGPEIRIRDFDTDKVTLVAGDMFTLTTQQIIGNQARVAISNQLLHRHAKKGTKILIDDGKIELSVQKIDKEDIVTKVITGGVLSRRKSINVPGVSIPMDYLSQQDIEDITFGIKHNVDYIALSFVRSAQDVINVKELLVKIIKDNESKLTQYNTNDPSQTNDIEDTKTSIECAKTVRLISKIENQQGVDNIDEIIKESDGIMVARGDMGVEIDFARLPAIQKKLITRCYEAGKIAITATQMLDSMEKNPKPTRAETSDVANAVYDGTSATMLSGESAAGLYPVLTLQTMARIIEQAESDIDYAKQFKEKTILAAQNSIYDTDNSIDKDKSTSDRISNAVSHATCSGANDLNANAIIVTTRSGLTARNISKFRPIMPIIAATSSPKTYQQLALNWGVIPVKSKEQGDSDKLFEHAIELAKGTQIVKANDVVVMTAGVPVGMSTNILKIEKVK